jgi:hypothetical protein
MFNIRIVFNEAGGKDFYLIGEYTGSFRACSADTSPPFVPLQGEPLRVNPSPLTERGIGGEVKSIPLTPFLY